MKSQGPLRNRCILWCRTLPCWSTLAEMPQGEAQLLQERTVMHNNRSNTNSHSLFIFGGLSYLILAKTLMRQRHPHCVDEVTGAWDPERWTRPKNDTMSKWNKRKRRWGCPIQRPPFSQKEDASRWERRPLPERHIPTFELCSQDSTAQLIHGVRRRPELPAPDYLSRISQLREGSCSVE